MQEESKDEQEPESVQINTMVEDEPILPTQSDPEGFFNASDDVSFYLFNLDYIELFGQSRRTCPAIDWSRAARRSEPPHMHHYRTQLR
jgi:hypothetical protein